MKDTKEQRKHVLTVVAIIGGGGVALFVLAQASTSRAPSVPQRASTSRSRSRSPGTIAPHSLNFGPNPSQPALDAALVNAREAALNTYDQSAVAERGGEEQYLLGVDQGRVQQAIAFNTNATNLKETGITTGAATTIAQEETAAQQAIAAQQASAAENIASTEAQPAQTQAQGGFWGSLLGGLGGLFGMLGFNSPAPIGAGTGYVDSNTGAPLGSFDADPFVVDPYGAIELPPASYDVPPVQVPSQFFGG